MSLNKFTKENITIGFYVIYILLAGILFEIFPGDAKTPNFGVLLLYVMIPISLGYFMYHLVKHLYSGISYSKCLLIHSIVWISIIAILTTFAK
jgi:hypothetical protein